MSDGDHGVRAGVDTMHLHQRPEPHAMEHTHDAPLVFDHSSRLKNHEAELQAHHDRLQEQVRLMHKKDSEIGVLTERVATIDRERKEASADLKALIGDLRDDVAAVAADLKAGFEKQNGRVRALEIRQAVLQWGLTVGGLVIGWIAKGQVEKFFG